MSRPRPLATAWIALGIVAALVLPLRVAEIHQAHQDRAAAELRVAAALRSN